ncbi:MAG: winged helix-turn-helix domain-containing protein [Asticcacaulis sp.]|nr:winged helix-turn-helix domain-containing protein [Asticcacaulis sp.]
MDLNAPYFDALCLLFAEPGVLVSKERFWQEVWRGVPVTDEALTQCIRTLRRALDDSATRPRFIETVTGHGYRFVAPVEIGAGMPPPANASVPMSMWLGAVRTILSGTVGAGVAGTIGGLLYGFIAVAQVSGGGGASVLAVVLIVTVVMALTGGAGVSLGIAAAGLAPAVRGWWIVPGAAAGGLVIGAVVKLVGLDAFTLLAGRAPSAMTGAPEGLVLGFVTGLGVWLGQGRGNRRSLAFAALAGAMGGAAIALSGGRLMLGSLVLLGDLPGSQLKLVIPTAGLLASAVLEGALFAACVAAAMRIGRR